MKTKAIAITSAFLLGAFISQAQSTVATSVGGTTFGLRAGVNFQNLNGEDLSGNDLENKLKTGFHIGINAEIPIAPEFYLQPGLLFSTKGAKSDADNDDKINLSYIELPVNFLYKPVLGTGKLLLGFGPYAGYAIGGKLKSDGGDMDLEFESELSASQIGQYYYTYKRFDFGANFLVGYEFTNKFSAQLNAQLGLTNISPKVDAADDAKTKNTGFGVSVGYRF